MHPTRVPDSLHCQAVRKQRWSLQQSGEKPSHQYPVGALIPQGGRPTVPRLWQKVEHDGCVAQTQAQLQTPPLLLPGTSSALNLLGKNKDEDPSLAGPQAQNVAVQGPASFQGKGLDHSGPPNNS